jgi:hypothetical protein
MADRSSETGGTLELADGKAMPMLGLGVWQVDDSRECVDAVRWALELGYRHIDTAQAYGNEESVGQGIRESGVAREEMFVTTKFFPRQDDPLAAVEESLRRLARLSCQCRKGGTSKTPRARGFESIPIFLVARARAVLNRRPRVRCAVRSDCGAYCD